MGAGEGARQRGTQEDGERFRLMAGRQLIDDDENGNEEERKAL